MLKEKYSYVNNSSKTAKDSMAMTTFTLPDGTDVSVKSSIFSECCNELCENKLFDVSGGGIVAQIQNSFDTCDEVLKREICQNIILCGGTSLLPGKICR
jgi:actin